MPLDPTLVRDFSERVRPSLDKLSRTPERAVLINEDFSEQGDIATLPRAMEFFWNPESLQISVGAEWARIPVPGLSHEVLQWSHNKSRTVEFTVQWDALEVAKRYGGNLLADASGSTLNLSEESGSESRDHYGPYVYRDFLHALVVPVSRGRAPSRVTFLWGNTLQLNGVVTSIEFDFQRFDVTGRLVSFSANIQMIELRTTFLARRGTFRYFIKDAWTPEGEAEARGVSIEEAMYGD